LSARIENTVKKGAEASALSPAVEDRF
jgi:hypothetical protein